MKSLLAVLGFLALLATPVLAQHYGGGPFYNASTHPAGSALQLNDDINLVFGTGSDFSCQWDTALTPDVLMCGDGTTPDQDLLIDNGAYVSFGAAVTSWTGDGVSHDNNGVAGLQPVGDTAPQGVMIRPQPAFPGGTQTAANPVICMGQDETVIAIDGADPSVTCADDNDTVTIHVWNSNGALTSTTLTEGTNWTATASVADTCASLATAVAALAGVGASCTSPNVRITLDLNTCAVGLAESTAGCTTVSVGTPVGLRLVGPSTGNLATLFLAANGGLTVTAAGGITLANAVSGGSSISAGTSLSATTTIRSSSTTTLGWSVVDGADDTACTSQCTNAAVFGFNLAAGATAPVLVGDSDVSADICVCAGAN